MGVCAMGSFWGKRVLGAVISNCLSVWNWKLAVGGSKYLTFRFDAIFISSLQDIFQSGFGSFSVVRSFLFHFRLFHRTSHYLILNFKEIDQKNIVHVKKLHSLFEKYKIHFYQSVKMFICDNFLIHIWEIPQLHFSHIYCTLYFMCGWQEQKLMWYKFPCNIKYTMMVRKHYITFINVLNHN